MRQCEIELAFEHGMREVAHGGGIEGLGVRPEDEDGLRLVLAGELEGVDKVGGGQRPGRSGRDGRGVAGDAHTVDDLGAAGIGRGDEDIVVGKRVADGVQDEFEGVAVHGPERDQERRDLYRCVLVWLGECAGGSH